MTGVQTCALPICFPVTITYGGEGLDSIRDSGEIAQIADSVLELCPIDEFVDDTGMRGVSIKFHKNRNGRLGTTSVAFNGAFQKFISS